MVKITESEKPGGFSEMNIDHKTSHDRLLNAQNLYLMDSTSPVPNDRAVELMLLSWVAHHTEHAVYCETTQSGTVGEYGPLWFENLNLETDICPNALKEWVAMFSDHTNLVTKESILPYVPFAMLKKSEHIMKLRKEKMLSIYEMLWPEKKMLPPIVITDLVERSSLSGLHVLESMETGKVMGKLPCPVCSYQQKKAVYHSIVKDVEGFHIARNDKGHGYTHCKASLIFHRKISEGISIEWLTKKLGFVLNGRPAFWVTKQAQKETVFTTGVRDYSNPRGSMAYLSELFGTDIFITPRIYLRNKDESDMTYGEYIPLLQNKTYRNQVRSFMKNTIPVSDGKVVHFC